MSDARKRDREREERRNPRDERHNPCADKRWLAFVPGYVPPKRCECGDSLGAGEDCPLCAQERVRLNQPTEEGEDE